MALVTVSDEGAAEMVRAALVDAGIQPEFERAYLEDPYRASILAEPWRVFVPAERIVDAQNALARLEHEMAEEVEAQAMAWNQGIDLRPDATPSSLPALPPPGWRPTRPAVAWALALSALTAFLGICLYARFGADPHRSVPSLTRPQPARP